VRHRIGRADLDRLARLSPARQLDGLPGRRRRQGVLA
jgi:hypothetical protein